MTPVSLINVPNNEQVAVNDSVLGAIDGSPDWPWRRHIHGPTMLSTSQLGELSQHSTKRIVWFESGSQEGVPDRIHSGALKLLMPTTYNTWSHLRRIQFLTTLVGFELDKRL